MTVLVPILLAAGTLVPDYFAIQNSFHDGAITGSEYATQLAGAIARPEETPPSLRTEQVGRGICLTTLALEALNAARDDAAAYDELARLFFRPPKQAAFVSPDGFFTIHYDTTGTHAVYQPTVDVNPADGVPDYVNRCAEIFDLSWRVEVDTLGFDPPGSDHGLGGSDNYDVYLHHYEGAYGVTFPEGPATEYPGRRAYYSHLFVDPTYSGFGYSDRLLPLKVTAAHEFQHACQFSYDTWEDSAWMEHCSTWMEDVVFDDVNDYVDYLPYFLSLPHKPLYLFDDLYPYGACVWAHFLDQKFGRDVIRLTWEQCINTTAQQGVDNVLRAMGASRDEAVAEFRIWNYFTGNRDDGQHYEEGASWPLVPFMADHAGLPVLNGAPVSGQAPASLACNYVRFRNLEELDSLRINFAGQSNRVWAASLIVPGAGSQPTEIGSLDLSGGQATGVVPLGEAGSVVMIPTCLSLSSGTYTYWVRDAYELFSLERIVVEDDLGNGDGRPDPGETLQIGAVFQNIAAQWPEISLTLSSADSLVTIVDGAATLALPEPGGTLESPPESLLVHVLPEVAYHRARFQLALGPPGLPPAMLVDFDLMLGLPPVLLVDDDGGATLERFITATFDSLGTQYDLWDDHASCFPEFPSAALDLGVYDAVVWFTGDAGNALSLDDITRVSGLLGDGSHLLLSGQDIAESLAVTAEGQALLAEIGISFDGKDGLAGVVGVDGDPVFGGLRFATFGTGLDGANNQTSRDRLTQSGDATICLNYQSGYPAAVRRESGDSRVLFVGFGIEAVVDNNPSVNTRRQFLSAALDYLIEGITVAEGPAPSVLRISGVWPNPTAGQIQAAVRVAGRAPALRVVLFDLAGRRVAELLDAKGAALPPVVSLRVPDATPSGAYLLRFETDGAREMRPLTLVR